jgi:hypothetical protein
MSFTSLRTKGEALLRVRPAFVLACVGFLIAITLPDMIAGRPVLQRAMLVLATIAVGTSWVLLLKHPEPNSRWRALLSLATAAYLTASIPAFFFELSPWKWLRHPGASAYVRPWVHWGYALMGLSILISFCSRGRARVALVVGSIALATLMYSMGRWLF